MMLTVLGVAAATIVLVVLALNFVPPEKKVQKQVRHFGGVDDPQFLREMGTLLGPPILGGNTVKALQNGDEIFPAMLEAIRGARRTITFETYIYWSGSIGKEFADALVERARAGVRVHVLLDWAGSLKMEDSLLDQMADAGVEIERFHPLHWYHLARLNNRTHRKLLVVDGTVGFTGGVGVADHWLGHAQDPEHWRDSHFRFEGPVVAQAQSVFNDNWIKATGEVLHGDTYFPTLKPTGKMDAQMFSSSPEGGSSSLHLMVLLAIAAATKTIDIENSYFVPDKLTIQTLIAARKRGVRVRVLVPSKHTDAKFGRWASQALYAELLKAGIEISEYAPTMIHCKIMVVDGIWTSVGSCNFDDRSFRLNDEANLNIFDETFARQQLEYVEADFAHSKRIVRGRWAQRSFVKRVLENIAILFRTQL
jgi:cardiolipin synthase